MQNFGPCDYQLKKELKMAGANVKNASWALLFFLVLLISTFQHQPPDLTTGSAKRYRNIA